MENSQFSQNEDPNRKTDQIYELIREFLPDIENELRKEITTELEASYQEKYLSMLEETKEETRKQVDSIIEEIKNEAFSAYKERIKALEVQEASIMALKAEYKDLVENEIKSELKEEFEREKDLLIKTLIEEMNQEKNMENYEKTLKDKVKGDFQEEMRRELQRKEKLLNINMKKKLQQEKKALQDSYDIEWRTKIEEAQKGLEKERNELNRLKSLENIRLKKLEADKKAIKSELQAQKSKYEAIISDLTLKNQEKQAEIPLESPNTTNKLDIDFEKAYLPNSVQKSPLKDHNSPFNRLFQKDQWKSNDEEGFTEPLSPPKLLYFDEDKVIKYEEAPNIKEKTLIGAFSETGNKRTLIGEYNTKEIAEEIIKLYSEKKNQADNMRNNDISRLVSNSVLKTEVPKVNCYEKTIQEGYSENLIGNNGSGLKERKSESNVLEKSSFIAEREQIRIEKKGKRVEEFKGKYKELLGKKQAPKKKEGKIEGDKEDNNKYKEIIRKYINKSENKPFSIDENNKVNKYESLFLIAKNDDFKVKEMKKLRKELHLRLIRDFNYEEKYLAMEIYLKNQMLRNIKCENIEHYSIIQNNINLLLESWVLNDISFKERIDFIITLENMLGEGEEINKRIENEIDFQQNHHKIAFSIIEKLKERNMLRSKLSIGDFSYSLNRKIYCFLHGVCEQLFELLEEYEGTQENEYFWRGISVKELIRCDLWEEEYLEKEEAKKQIYARIKKRIL